MLFVVKLTRNAIETAIIEVDAKTEVEAVNVAFKEIDRLRDQPADKRVHFVDLTLKPDGDSVWEELSVEKT